MRGSSDGVSTLSDVGLLAAGVGFAGADFEVVLSSAATSSVRLLDSLSAGAGWALAWDVAEGFVE
jgi:hypothetical protein